MALSEITVLYADDTLLILDKPAGLLAVPGRGADKQDCLSARAQQRYPDALVVHRLDMATSGIMVLARGAAAQRTLSSAFAKRSIAKRYVAVVQGCLAAAPENWGVIDLPIAADWPNRPRRVIDHQSGKASLTRWRVVWHDAQRNTTRIELEPVTGRSHQLRVHLLALGHPIVGDTLYGGADSPKPAERMLLHACALEMTHPVSFEMMRFVNAPPF